MIATQAPGLGGTELKAGHKVSELRAPNAGCPVGPHQNHRPKQTNSPEGPFVKMEEHKEHRNVNHEGGRRRSRAGDDLLPNCPSPEGRLETVQKQLSVTVTPEIAKDLSPSMERAVKYVWNDQTADWETKRIQIIMEEEPFKEGGMRVAHKAWEISGDKMVAGVAKYFKEREISSNMCFNEAMTQMLADDFAIRFNDALQGPRNIRFVAVTVLRLSERSGQIVSFEPFLGGKYVKHNDNDGHVDTNDLLPQAFSHFTFEASDRKLLVCDIQGVGDFYTDPQIHSVDGEGFGTGNMGMGGVAKFFKSHKCNAVCKHLGLAPADHLETEAKSKRQPQQTYSSDEELEAAGHNPEHKALREQVAKAFEDRGRAQRRRTSSTGLEDMNSLSLTGSNTHRSKSKIGRGRLSSLWSNGKAFGKALLSAVASSVHSPPSSRSISPANRGRTASGDPELAPPQSYRRRRPSVEHVPVLPSIQQ